MPQSYRPPARVAAAARRALEIRASQPRSRRAGTAVGVARANQLAARRPLSVDTIQRMYSFFRRHEKTPGAAAARKRSATSKAAQAWGLWGGDSGYRWARRMLRDLGLLDEDS